MMACHLATAAPDIQARFV